MKTVIGLLTTLLLCSCVYEVPLVEEAVIPANRDHPALFKDPDRYRQLEN